MPIVNVEHEFARMLGALEREPFEEEVCRFLRRSVHDFQHVPAKPQGDAGLDGYSHQQTVADCCYGPEEPSKLTPKALAKKIIEKFRDDLRRLFEVKPQGKNKLVHAPNNEMPTIMGKGRKFKVVRLVVSVLDTHQVLGPLNDAFDACRQASQCLYVEKTAGVTIWGPKELATTGAVDDVTIIRLQQRDVVNRLELVLASPPTNPAPLSTNDFDSKFDWLDANTQPRPGGTSKMRAHFMNRWLAAIAVENDFANNALALHRALWSVRRGVVVEAEIESKSQSNAAELIKAMRATLMERLGEAFGNTLPRETIRQLVDGELGLLIGECPVDWRS